MRKGMGAGPAVLVPAVLAPAMLLAGSLAGCGAAIAGTAVPVPVPKLRAENVKAACPLLPAGAVAKAYRTPGVRAEEKGPLTSDPGGSFTCDYVGNNVILLKLIFVRSSDPAATPQDFTGGVTQGCTQVYTVSGLGDSAVSCHPANSKATLVATSRKTSRELVAVAVAGAKTDRLEATLERFARQVLAHF